MPETPSALRPTFALGRGQARVQLLHFLRRLILLCGLLVLLVAAGTLGFVLTEDVSVWHGFVWSLDTVATIGSIQNPQDAGGEIVKVALIIFGVGTLFYALVTVTEFFVAGHMSGLLEERRIQRMVDSFSNHHVICGFGRVGRQVARDLRAAGEKFVVVDTNPESRELCAQEGIPHIEGRPSEDDILRQAGIDRAKAVIACMDSDAENIFTSLTARELRDDISVVARASEEDSESKLKRAGATRVVSPYKASGSVMARLALNPQVTGVTDVTPEYRMEEIEVTSDCDGAGQTIEQVGGASVVVALRRDGTLMPQPTRETELQAGDVVVAMGSGDAMDRLESRFARRHLAGDPG